MKTRPQYNDADIKALEHVSMLIDEYMCSDDDKLTDSGKALKELVENFYSQWEKRIYECDGIIRGISCRECLNYNCSVKSKLT